MVWSVKHSGDGDARLRPTSKRKRREYFTRETCTSKSLLIRIQEKLAQSEELRALAERQRQHPTLLAVGNGGGGGMWEITPVLQPISIQSG